MLSIAQSFVCEKKFEVLYSNTYKVRNLSPNSDASSLRL